MTDNAIALDFETYYVAAYLVALHSDDYHWVGPPKEADWSRLKAALAVVHNASFEKLVIMRLLQDGIIPADCAPREYFDTADMVAYLGCIRKLDVASKELLGRPMSKAVRTGMKGRTLRQVEPWPHGICSSSTGICGPSANNVCHKSTETPASEACSPTPTPSTATSKRSFNAP